MRLLRIEKGAKKSQKFIDRSDSIGNALCECNGVPDNGCRIQCRRNIKWSQHLFSLRRYACLAFLVSLENASLLIAGLIRFDLLAKYNKKRNEKWRRARTSCKRERGTLRKLKGRCMASQLGSLNWEMAATGDALLT